MTSPSSGAICEFTVHGSYCGYKQLAKADVWQVAQQRKDRDQQDIVWQIRAAGVQPITDYPVVITVTVYQKDRRKDADNVKAGATKIILDAMKTAGIIKDDCQKYVADVMWGPLQTSINDPRVHVLVERAKKGGKG